MFVQTQDTPNPNTIKFLLPDIIILKGSSISLTRGSPMLAKFPIAIQLFKLEEVESLMIANGFIAVTKSNNASWDTLRTFVLSEMLDMLSQKLPFILENKEESKAENSIEQDISCSITNQIKELLDQMIRPAVAQDGGDIIFVEFKEGIVYLELRGACSGCPSSTITLKNGIENTLKHYIPEVVEVKAV